MAEPAGTDGTAAPRPVVHRSLRSEVRSVTLHGHEVSYRIAGSGPVLLLLHGVAGNSTHWESVIAPLAHTHTVIAPDLLGHGLSAKPRGDYSLGAFASGMRDLLLALGHDRATVVGHSLGGGIALQFAYQFSQHCERLVLVASGGLGPEVHPLLRAASLPGAEWVMPIVCNTTVLDAGKATGRLLRRIGVPRPGRTLREIGEGFEALCETEGRAAFVHTLRSVVDVRGQRVDARDRLYLAQHMPILIVWGGNDAIIPVAHGLAAHEALPGSRLEIFEEAGHFPFRDEPGRFAATLLDFLETTEPSERDRDLREYFRPADG